MQYYSILKTSVRKWTPAVQPVLSRGPLYKNPCASVDLALSATLPALLTPGGWCRSNSVTSLRAPRTLVISYVIRALGASFVLILGV